MSEVKYYKIDKTKIAEWQKAYRERKQKKGYILKTIWLHESMIAEFEELHKRNNEAKGAN